MEVEIERKQKQETLAKLSLDDLNKVVRLSFDSNYDKFGKLTPKEQSNFYIDLEIKAAGLKQKDLEAAKSNEEEEAINAKFKQGGVRTMVDLNLDSSLMLKSFGKLKMLYNLKTWTSGQEIAWKTLIAVCSMEVIIIIGELEFIFQMKNFSSEETVNEDGPPAKKKVKVNNLEFVQSNYIESCSFEEYF